ncbi:MAG TPA: MarR family transcriptional regulator [Chloroflexota bacterium]|nr:MarR family transcriptional regulator [Chloroflexota bacterium]
MNVSGEEAGTVNDALRQVGTMLRLLRALDQELRLETPATLSLAELSVLSQVNQGTGLPSQVARALRMDPARVTHLVDRLVTADALTRTPDPTDRRCWRLALTSAGAQHLVDGRARIRDVLERLLDGLTADERAGLSAGLLGVRRLLDAALSGAGAGE